MITFTIYTTENLNNIPGTGNDKKKYHCDSVGGPKEISEAKIEKNKRR